ncbi:MAG: SdpI family protein [Clostridia bacterium]|nr:SdpI family protein [Clostridia bacterium]MBQ8370531.1 SdpI family protein [Clostridia bacterium]
MNGYWLYMLITSLMIPCIMIVFGGLFRRKAPKNINIWYGYRTQRSMKNEDTWAFAHRHLGRTWLIVGAVMHVVSVIPMIAVLGKDEDTVSVVSLVLLVVQLIPMIVSLIPTERALRQKFDENGNRYE